MMLDGHTVLVEKGRWVDEDKLYDPAHFNDILDRLAHLLRNPDYPAYIQRSELKRIRRIRMNDLRVYAKLIPAAKILTVLAVVGRGEIKRDETTGELDFDFMAYLHMHATEFLADRFIPLEVRGEKVQVVAPVTESPVFWSATYECVPLDPQEAISALASTKPQKGRWADFKMDPICEDLMQKVERADPGDKILFPLPEEDHVWGRPEIHRLQVAIRAALQSLGKHYFVSFDDISQKIVLVPPHRKAIYMSGKGHRAWTRWDADTQGRV